METKAAADKKRSVYQKAKAEYEHAKDAREGIEAEITNYLNSLKKEEVIEMETSTGTDTAVENNTIAYAGGMVLTGAACLALLRKWKEEKEY